VKRLFVLGLMLVSACGPPVRTAPSGASSSAQVQATLPTTSASPGAYTSASQQNGGIASVSFACRLPLAQPVPPSDGSNRWSVAGAFVSFPGGALTIDPNGAFTSSQDGRLKSVTQPYLFGGEAGATYTRRYGRWLPARVPAVSPDSSHYAYSEFIEGASRHSRIHVVDVMSGADRVVYDQDFYAVRDYEAEGVYLVNFGPSGEGSAGLWLLDPRSGSIRAVAPPQSAGAPFGFYLVGAGAAWYGDVAPGDQPPNSGIGPLDRVLRFDLKSRVVTPWFRRPGMQVQAIGFDDNGHLIVMATTEMAGIAVRPGQGSVELWRVTAAGVAQPVYSSSTSTDFVGYFNSLLADNHGLWLAAVDGIFLSTPDGKFQKVSTAVGEIAGRCS
jgi:hypothetical protein